MGAEGEYGQEDGGRRWGQLVVDENSKVVVVTESGVVVKQQVGAVAMESEKIAFDGYCLVLFVEGLPSDVQGEQVDKGLSDAGEIEYLNIGDLLVFVFQFEGVAT